MVTKSVLAISTALLLCSLSHSARADISKSCQVVDCAPGDKGVTYGTREEPYYTCPTRDLTDYTNFVLGIVVTQKMLTGRLPNISDTTGEPEFLDDEKGPNMTRLIIERLRHKAGVETFDQAMKSCSEGKSGVRVTVMNNPKDESSIWVQNDKSKATFWMPKSALDKK